jgi:hypothetical protein
MRLYLGARSPRLAIISAGGTLLLRDWRLGFGLGIGDEEREGIGAFWH